MDALLDVKYKEISTFYCHNLGGFEAIFILKALINHNDNDNNNDKSKIKVFCINGYRSILNLIISKNINGINRSVSISDSYAILTDSLKNLSIKYKYDVVKGDFPPKFNLPMNLHCSTRVLYRTYPIIKMWIKILITY